MGKRSLVARDRHKPSPLGRGEVELLPQSLSQLYYAWTD